MIRVILLFVILVVGLITGPNLVGEKGYVLIALKNTTIEMSVISLGVMVFFAVIGFLVIEWLIKRIVGMLTGSRNWLGSWGSRRRQSFFNKGMQALAEGDFVPARKALLKIRNAEFNGLNLLALADVEAKLGNTQAALGYWDEAALNENSALAAQLTKARFLISQNDSKAALAIIENLTIAQKTKANVIEVWAEGLAAADKWHELRERLTGWKKALGGRYQHWQDLAAEGDFALIASNEGGNELIQEWQKLPRAQRKSHVQQKAYIEQLIAQDMHSEAEKALVEAQKSGPHTQLLPLFKKLHLAEPKASTKLLQKWLKRDSDNVLLHSTLAHLAYHAGNDELAQSEAEAAIAIEERQEDVILLAEIKARQAHPDEALALYQQGYKAS